MDKIIILQHWHKHLSRKIFNVTESDIINNLTKTDWDRFCNAYIGKKTHNTPPVQTKTGVTKRPPK